VTDKTAYLASQSSYGSKKHSDKLRDLGYILDEELSSDNAKVYSDGKHSVVAYRGTVLTDKKDLIADKSILLNNYQDDPSFKEAEVLYEKTRSKYGGNILLTGHSLGATKAISVSKKYGNKSNIIFNAGTGLARMDTPNVKVYNHKDDPISGRVDKSDVLLDTKVLNPHSLDN
jgi:hypothetical protein